MYKHGIEVTEKTTAYERPLSTEYGVQVVIGTAPVHLTADPAGAVNRPVLLNSFAEAEEALGYSDDWEKYTLCQSMYASWQLFHVYPAVFINVLDPEKHSKKAEESPYPVSNHQVTLEQDGILLDTVTINQGSGARVGTAKVGSATVGEQAEGPALVKDQDYIVSVDENGKTRITLLSTGSGYELAEISIGYQYLDPSMVTEADMIGAYDLETGKETGLELVRQVYPL